MKKLLLGLWLALAPIAAFGQCTGVFPPNTLCGNLGASPAPPSAFSAGGGIIGPGTSTLNGLPKWGNTNGTSLVDAAGTTVAGAYTWSGAQTFNGTNVFGGSATFNALANFTSTFQIGGQTFTWPVAGTTVAGLGTNQTFSGNNTFTGNETFSTGTVNLTGTTELNGGDINTVLTDNSILNNCSITGSVGSSNLTINLKDASGADPSASSPCAVGFRNSTASTGTYSIVKTTGALSIVVPSGATLGTASGAAFRVWVLLFNNGGTPILGVFQSVVGGATPTAIAPLMENDPQSPAAIGAGSTSGGTYYAASALTAKAFRILGYLTFSNGQVTAGTWATAPDKIQIFGPGIKKPGEEIQHAWSQTGASSTGTTVIAINNTIPQNTAGDQYMSQAITPTSTANILEISSQAIAAVSTGNQASMSLLQDSTANALAATTGEAINSDPFEMHITWLMRAGTTSSTTFKVNVGGTAGTLTFNGFSGGRVFGGVANSFLRIREFMT